MNKSDFMDKNIYKQKLDTAIQKAHSLNSIRIAEAKQWNDDHPNGMFYRYPRLVTPEELMDDA